nr:hypothetical protein [uncultured Blautia sp.]
MLKWCKDLRIGEGVKKADKIRRKLNHGKIVPGVYLITFSENPRNLLEIIPALTLIQQSAADICPEIIGLACDKDEAVDMVTEIIQEVYDKTGDFHIEEYWKNR